MNKSKLALIIGLTILLASGAWFIPSVSGVYGGAENPEILDSTDTSPTIGRLDIVSAWFGGEGEDKFDVFIELGDVPLLNELADLILNCNPLGELCYDVRFAVDSKLYFARAAFSLNTSDFSINERFELLRLEACRVRMGAPYAQDDFDTSLREFTTVLCSLDGEFDRDSNVIRIGNIPKSILNVEAKGSRIYDTHAKVCMFNPKDYFNDTAENMILQFDRAPAESPGVWGMAFVTGYGPEIESESQSENSNNILAQLADFTNLAVKKNWEFEQFSSYDRRGLNMDCSWYWYAEPDGQDHAYIIADADGPGALVNFWMTEASFNAYSGVDDWGLEDIMYGMYLDEISTRMKIYFDNEIDPRVDVPLGQFYGLHDHEVFKSPIAGFGSGGVVNYVPMMFRDHCTVVASRWEKLWNYWHTGVLKFPSSQGVETFNIPLTEAYNEAYAPFYDKFQSAFTNPGEGQFITSKESLDTVEVEKTVPAGKSAMLLELENSGIMKAFYLNIDDNDVNLTKNMMLKIYWDNEKQPSVDVPVAHFFSSSIKNSDNHALPVGRTPQYLYSLFPMPYSKGAKVILENRGEADVKSAKLRILYESVEELPEGMLRFHTQFNKEQPTVSGTDFTILRENGTGHYVGVMLHCIGTDENGVGFLEGDEHVWVDGKISMVGTGTEDYFQGGWYYNRGEFSWPVHGCLCRINMSSGVGMVTQYRFHIADCIPFEESIDFRIEHGHANSVNANYESVAYYYLAAPDGKSGILSGGFIPDFTSAALVVSLVAGLVLIVWRNRR